MNVTKKSLLTGTVRSRNLNITEEQLDLFEQGEVQLKEAFPNLTPEEREFIATGVDVSEIEDPES
jgi:hypothetical protein